MPGGNFEHAFDVSDVEADIRAEKQQQAEQKNAKHPAEELVDLTDEAMEIAPDVSEDGTEMKQLIEDIVDEGTGQTELKSALKDIGIDYKKGSAGIEKPIPLEDDIETLDSDLLEEEPGQTIEMTADYEGENIADAKDAAKAYDQAVADAEDDYEAQAATLKKELDAMNQTIKKNPSSRTMYQPRINTLNAELSNLEDSRNATMESARKKYETFMDNDPAKIASLEDARAKRQNQKKTGGLRQAA